MKDESMNWKVIPLTKPVLAFISLDFQWVAHEMERVDQRDCCKFTYLGIFYFTLLGLIGFALPSTYTVYVLFALIPFAFLVLLKYNKFWLVTTMGVIVVTTAIIQICQTANKWPNHPVGQKVLLTLHLILVVYSFASGIPLVYHELSRPLLDPEPDNLDWSHYIHLYGPALSTFSNAITAISSQIVVTDNSSGVDRVLGRPATGWVVTTIGVTGNLEEVIYGVGWLRKWGGKVVRGWCGCVELCLGGVLL